MTASQPSQGAAPRLARHLARCTPCRDGLDALSAQRGVLATLGRGRGDDVHLVDEVLEACAQDGREKLADLLYEMAVASMHLVPEDLAPGEVTKNPDPVKRLSIEVLAGSAVEVCARVPDACVGDRDFPDAAPDPEVAAQTARRCLTLLEQVEGPSARRRFGEAYVAQMETDYDGAIGALKPLCEEPLPEWLWRGVRWGLMSAYLRSGRPHEAIKVGKNALDTCPDDRTLIFNMAAAFGSLGDGAGFDRMCEKLSTSRSQHEDLDWWRSFIADESTVLASELGRSLESVVQSLALPELQDEANA